MHIGLFEEQLLDLVAESTNASLIETLALLEGCYPLVDFRHMYLNFYIIF